MAHKTKRIEIWADSFHEGDWACANLAKIHEEAGGSWTHRYSNSFIPEYCLEFDDTTLELVVYGSYGTWSPLPKPIEELIAWGKPDFIAYDPVDEKILFAVEETAAVPTGNQALQRCERLYASSRKSVPFWYLLAEYGLHKDGGIRRDSIWPTIMALKLSARGDVPSAVLHYADSDNPEGYDFGTGVTTLFSALLKMLSNFVYSEHVLAGMKEEISEHYQDMLRFVRSQYKSIIPCVPGLDELDDVEYSNHLASLSNHELADEVQEESAKYRDLMVWPKTAAWKKQSGATPEGKDLIKSDPLCKALENALTEGRCYNIGGNAGSRPQKPDSIREWIRLQNKSFQELRSQVQPPAKWNLKLSDFPPSKTGNRHVTTAKNIVYLFDKYADVKSLIYSSYPRLKGKLDAYKQDQGVFFYVSNSLVPGRIFGDPFTGQIAAYATVFGRFDPEPRLVLTYYPHQSFAQMLDSDTKQVKNKGFLLMRELVDLAIFGGGVAVDFDDNGRGRGI